MNQDNNILHVVDDKLLQQKIGFIPHKAQQEILDGMKRFTTIAAGRRFGKTQLCAYLALRELIAKNRNIWIVAPTYGLSEKVFNYIVQWIGQYFPTTFTVQRAPYPIIKSPTGSRLEGKSAENVNALMGEELDLVIIDEAAAMDKEVWETYLFPSLAHRQGRMIGISTPKGLNWFHGVYIKENTEPEKYKSFHFESKDNPTFPIEEWEMARLTLPQDIFQQEYQAIFLSDAAAVFRNIESCIKGELEAPRKDRIYVMGVDLGKFQDFTVIVVIDLFNFHVVHVDRFNKLDWTIQKQRIINTAKKYNDAQVTIDSTGKGDPIVDDLLAQGLSVEDFRYTNKSKTQLIAKLSIYIEQRKISFPHIKSLKDELQAFGYTRTKTGKFQYGAPEGQYDDQVNALALAVWNLDDEPMMGSGTQIFTFEKTDF